MNIGKQFFLMLLCCSIFGTLNTGCQTLKQTNEADERQTEVLATQKTVIVSFLNKGLPGLALKELRRVMRENPDDADFFNLLGLTHLALENPDKAISNFKRSYEIDPRTSVGLNLSSAYIEDKRFNQAISTLEVIKKSKDIKDYQYPERLSHNLALAYERLGNLNAAIKHYTLALSENPNYYLTLMRLGQVYEKKKKRYAAQDTFRKARSACPACFDPVNALVVNYMAAGKHRAAYESLQRFKNAKTTSAKDKRRAVKLMSMVKRLAIKNRKARRHAQFNKNNTNKTR